MSNIRRNMAGIAMIVTLIISIPFFKKIDSVFSEMLLTEIHECDCDPLTYFFGYHVNDIDMAKRYHGISSATFSSDDEPFFYRDGQKIYLFRYWRDNGKA